MSDDFDPESLAVKSFRARCMHCGARFETPAEVRLHADPGSCRPKFWFWFANQHPWLLAWMALSIGYLIGLFF